MVKGVLFKMNSDISRFKDIVYERRTHCVICGEKSGPPVIKLPGFPMTEIYTKKRIAEKAGFLDQNFHLCGCCGHGQLENIIGEDPADLVICKDTLEHISDPKSFVKKVLRQASPGRPLEDISPYLARKEFLANMLIEPLPESKREE